jgi:hypothetical protein
MNKRLLIIIIIAVILRIGVAFVMGDGVEVLPGIFDQVSYHTLATRLSGGHGFTFEQEWWPVTKAGEPTAHWSYLYTLYLTGVYALMGVHPLVARLVQAAAVGVLMPWLAYRLAQRAWPGLGVKVGKVELDAAITAAAWVAVYPYFIYYGAALMTESFYITGILWVLDCGLRIAHSQDREGAIAKWRWVELGATIGVTVLLRQLFLLFVPFLLTWLAWVRARLAARSEGGMWKHEVWKVVVGGAVSGIVVMVMIAPFTILNYRQFGRFVLLNTNAGYAFFWANHPIHGDRFVALFTEDMPSYQELIPNELRGLDEAALEKALMQRGMRFIIEDPWRYVKLSISRIPDHFIFWPLPESSLVSNITRVGSLGVALPLMLLGGGLWIVREYRGSRSWLRVSEQAGALLLLFIGAYAGVHLLSWAGIRYRLPTDAVGLVFAAGGLVWLAGRIVARWGTASLRSQ